MYGQGSQVGARSVNGQEGHEGEDEDGVSRKERKNEEEKIEINTKRYYRHWWTKKKQKRSLTFIDVSDSEESSDDENDLKNSHNRPHQFLSVRSPPPRNSHISIHQSFNNYNPEHSHTHMELERLRKRRLEELFLNLKLFVSPDSDDDTRSTVTVSRKQPKKV